MDKLVVQSVTYKGANPPEALSFPDFEVTGTFDNEPFVVKVGISLDDRDFEFEVLKGLSGFASLPDGGVDLEVEIIEKIGESPAYKEAEEAYENQEETYEPET